MSDVNHIDGQCLCGAVKVRASIDADVTACHCSQCRRWTGGGPLYSVRASDLQITGEENIAAYRHSEHGERCFCKTCGTTLWWRMQGKPIAFVTPGLFDAQDQMRVTEEIFVDHRAAWQMPCPGATQSTEAEELEKLHAYLAKEKLT